MRYVFTVISLIVLAVIIRMNSIDVVVKPLNIPVLYHFVYTDSTIINSDLENDLCRADTITADINTAFENKINFVEDSTIQFNVYHKSANELYLNLKEGDGQDYLKMIEGTSKEGYLNIYIINTENPTVLMGFTPVLTDTYIKYRWWSPRFDNIIVSDINGRNTNVSVTIIHEIGHWLGLDHPFELNVVERIKLGIHNDIDMDDNYMNYGPTIHKFTNVQIKSMRKFTMKYRRYILIY